MLSSILIVNMLNLNGLIDMDYKKLSNIDSVKYLCICLPSSVRWLDYMDELNAVEDWSQEMLFKVSCLPKQQCERCYLCHKGYIIGWQKITGYVDNTNFQCTTTGKTWEGNFIKRSGPFHRIKPVPYKSFRGFRYIDSSLVNE